MIFVYICDKKLENGILKIIFYWIRNYTMLKNKCNVRSRDRQNLSWPQCAVPCIIPSLWVWAETMTGSLGHSVLPAYTRMILLLVLEKQTAMPWTAYGEGHVEGN